MVGNVYSCPFPLGVLRSPFAKGVDSKPRLCNLVGLLSDCAILTCGKTEGLLEGFVFERKANTVERIALMGVPMTNGGIGDIAERSRDFRFLSSEVQELWDRTIKR